MKNKIKILLGLLTLTLIVSALVISNRGQAVTATVSILAEEFDPEIITIQTGDTITWTNNSSSNKQIVSDPHPTHSDLPGLNSGILSPGQSYNYTFTQVGEFGYHDEFNFEAGGIITVEATPTPSPTPTPTPAPIPTPTPVPTPTPPSTSPYIDGTLILDNGTIYVIEFGKKRPFASMIVFTGLGYKLSNVFKVSSSGIPLGDGVFDATKRHVRGAIVLNNGTAYFMGTGERFAFPSAEIFLSWGLRFQDLVNANSADIAIPQGPLMFKKP